ncbi:MAG: hypothetical protein JHD35_09960 [Sphingopyxis sp.]|nr:hypothetical protein [Sphingopyxis sp.]
MRGAMMRLLMVMGVLLCSMHIAEPASAHATDQAFHIVPDAGHDDQQAPAPDMAHGGHHHCPVAPDLRTSVGDSPPPLTRGLLFASPALPLASREPPPLLDPPLA